MIARVTRNRAIRPRGAGQTLVEFALIVPIFLVLLMTLVDLGRVIYAQNAITQDVHAASRFASVEAPQDAAAIKARAQLVSPAVVYDPVTAIQLSYPDGVDPPDAEGQRVRVSFAVRVPLLTPIIGSIVGGSITVSAQSEELIRSLKPTP